MGVEELHHPWSCRHRSRWSTQGKARGHSEAAGFWTAPGHRTHVCQRMPTPWNQPEICHRHQDQVGCVRSQGPRVHQRRVLRQSEGRGQEKEGDIFETKKEEYKPSEQRKKDQAEVDKQVMAVIKKHPEAHAMKQYLNSCFRLSKGEYPHAMVF